MIDIYKHITRVVQHFNSIYPSVYLSTIYQLGTNGVTCTVVHLQSTYIQ